MEMHKYIVTSVNELGCRWTYTVIAASMQNAVNSFKYAHPLHRDVKVHSILM